MLRKVLPFLLFLISMAASAQQYVRKTNLPTVYINTFNNAAITSKEVYIYATMHYGLRTTRRWMHGSRRRR